ncbi:hypothetical protein ACTFIU_009052 [Dictyostelium citrinum]
MVIDHQELKEPTKRIIRYLDKASEFKFDIIHLKGEDNHIADMLSRDGTFNSTWEPEFIESINRVYSKVEGKDAEWFELFKAREDVVNVDKLWYLIDSHTAKTKWSINYFFPKFIQLITRFTDSCMECQKNRIIRAKNVLLNPLPIPCRPWNDISMDFIYLPKSNSCKDNAMREASSSSSSASINSNTSKERLDSLEEKLDNLLSLVNRFMKQSMNSSNNSSVQSFKRVADDSDTEDEDKEVRSVTDERYQFDS